MAVGSFERSTRAAALKIADSVSGIAERNLPFSESVTYEISRRTNEPGHLQDNCYVCTLQWCLELPCAGMGCTTVLRTFLCRSSVKITAP